MPDVTLGPAGSAIVVDLDVCVKSGVATAHRVTVRGQATPAWVTVLLLFTVVGYLFAGAMTSRGYRVTLPFSHSVHDRWRNNRRIARGAGAVGTAAVVAAAFVGDGMTGLVLGVGLAFVAGGFVLGVANALRNNVGFYLTRDGELVLTRAHRAFARAVRGASVERLSS